MANQEIEQTRFPPWSYHAAITILSALLFVLRLSAPPNLLDQDQERPGTYVLDVVKNGNWLCQRDLNGQITYKPPLYTWLAALAALVRGRVDEFALYLPGALSAWALRGSLSRSAESTLEPGRLSSPHLPHCFVRPA